MIYSPNRKVSMENLEKHIELAAQLHQKYPKFIIGFDLVGEEDGGNNLSEYSQRLSTVELPFYFHAGESLQDLGAENLVSFLIFQDFSHHTF